MAMAIAVSAAEMAMENRAKKYPSSSPGKRKRLNTAKLISVAFSISSTEIRIMQVWINGKVMLSLFGEFDTPHLTANQIRSLYQPFSFNGANRCGKYMLRICNRTFSAKFRNNPKCLLFLLCKSYSLHNLLVFCKFTKYYANMCCCAILFYR